MIRAKLPWLFLALAVAAPPLLFWYVSWSIPDDDYEGTGAGIGYFIFLPIASLICISVFLTLAGLTWNAVSEWHRSLRLLVLLFFGGPSALIGFAMFAFTVANATNASEFLMGGGASAVVLAVAFIAARESILELGSDDPAEDGEQGGSKQFAGRHRR